MDEKLTEKISDFTYTIHECNEDIIKHLKTFNESKEIIDIDKFKETVKFLANRIKMATEEIIKILSA